MKRADPVEGRVAEALIFLSRRPMPLVMVF